VSEAADVVCVGTILIAVLSGYLAGYASAS
jgi:hypothetical protein